MKKVLKWIGIVLAALIILIVGAAGFLYFRAEQMITRVRSVPADNINIPTGEEAIARGEGIAVTRLCTECHREGLRGGEVFLDDPNSLGTFASPNLTSGKGGVGADFTDQDWVNAIRYGVDPNGRSLLFMPSESYAHLNDEDLGYLIAYIKSLPPVDEDPPDRVIGPVGHLLLGSGQFSMAADLVNKLPPRPAAVPVGPTAEYGEYIAASICTHCHGDNLAGMMWTKGDTEPRLTPNLTPGGELLVWSQDDFVKAMRTGVTPGGKTLNAGNMPWTAFNQYSDEELAALFAYLKSLPKTPSPSTN